MKKCIAVFLVCMLILSLIGCTAATSEDVPEPTQPEPDNEIVVWGWGNEFESLATVLSRQDNALAERIRLVNTGGIDNYQNKLDAVLADKTAADYPDIVLLQADFTKKYVQSGMLMSARELGISDEDMSGMFSYCRQLGSDADENDTFAFFWTAEPGMLMLRADLAQTWLGTTEPDKLQAMLDDRESILATAKRVNDASGGRIKLFSGYDELFDVYCGSRMQGWYDGSRTVTVDQQMTEYMELTKSLVDGQLTFVTRQWSAGWLANKDGDGIESTAAIAFTCSPLTLRWSMSTVWEDNTILVAGPALFYLGGNAMAVTRGCTDPQACAQIVKLCTCDSTMMTKLNGRNGAFVNNITAIQTIASEQKDDPYIFGGQNTFGLFANRAQQVDASAVTAEDSTINTLWETAVYNYSVNQVQSVEAAEIAFRSAVNGDFPDISAGRPAGESSGQ